MPLMMRSAEEREALVEPAKEVGGLDGEVEPLSAQANAPVPRKVAKVVAQHLLDVGEGEPEELAKFSVLYLYVRRHRAFDETELIGSAPAIVRVRQAIERVAPTGSRVMISGPPASNAADTPAASDKMGQADRGPQSSGAPVDSVLFVDPRGSLSIAVPGGCCIPSAPYKCTASQSAPSETRCTLCGSPAGRNR